MTAYKKYIIGEVLDKNTIAVTEVKSSGTTGTDSSGSGADS